jgi:aryl-alcohol dehydrogenase-like predicted oxidoreductase
MALESMNDSMNASATSRLFAGVPAVGLGCMNLSHAYGHPPSREAAEGILHRAFEIGIRHFDSAALYGFGNNESLLGPVLKKYRRDILLVSKGGMTGVDGKRVIDGRPETILRTCDESLRRLQTDVIDIYYLHRWDKNIPLEDSMAAMKQLVLDGKVRAIGLSEVSALTLRRAHAIHPIAAVQSEYSLWSRNVEVAVLDACAELGATFVAFAPLARGFLSDTDLLPARFADKDIRRFMPRFQEPHFSENAKLLRRYRDLAREAGCTAAQLALAWILNKHPGIHVIPGTTSIAHLEENFAALAVSLTQELIEQVDSVINSSTVSGPRYNAATQAEIDTEEIVA